MKTNRRKPFYVMIATPVTPSTPTVVCETRFGRWFASIDAASRLAKRIGGFVYERCTDGRHVMHMDCTAKATIHTNGGGWLLGKGRS